MLKILRSASPAMTRVRIAAAVWVILLYCCCNAEKRVLNNSDKTQRVVNKYLETHPARTDTVSKFIPGDTVTQLLIGYDTTYIHDTVSHRDVQIVNKKIYKTVTRVDTIVKTIQDNRLLQACQDGLSKVDYDKKQAVLDKQTAEGAANSWRLKFWVAVLIMVAGIAALIFLKR